MACLACNAGRSSASCRLGCRSGGFPPQIGQGPTLDLSKVVYPFTHSRRSADSLTVLVSKRAATAAAFPYPSDSHLLRLVRPAGPCGIRYAPSTGCAAGWQYNTWPVVFTRPPWQLVGSVSRFRPGALCGPPLFVFERGGGALPPRFLITQKGRLALKGNERYLTRLSLTLSIRCCAYPSSSRNGYGVLLLLPFSCCLTRLFFWGLSPGTGGCILHRHEG